MSDSDPIVKNQLYCSFCGKEQSEVFMMICGPSVFICDECATLSTEIVIEHHRKQRNELIEQRKTNG